MNSPLKIILFVRLSCALVISLVVSACGGGGGNVSTTVNNPILDSPPAIKPVVDPPVSTLTSASISIGPAGGVAQTSDAAVRVELPADALTTTQRITVLTGVTDTPPGNVGNIVVNLGPDGAVFGKNVKIRVQYDPHIFAPSMKESDLSLSYSDGNQWIDIPTAVDALGKTLTANLTHFSTYGVTLSNTSKKPYGTLLGEVNGVSVYSNGCLDPSVAPCGSNPDVYNTTSVPGYNTGLKWQCVELVNRYYAQRYGTDIRIPGENANLYFKNAAARGLVRYQNGGAERPRVGDILVSESGKFGHVAIVTRVTDDVVYYAQQNWNEGPGDLESAVQLSFQRGNYVVGNFSPSYSVVGWVRSPKSTVAPVGLSPVNDTGITASQCYAKGSNALVSCSSPAAVALSDKQDGMVGRDVATMDTNDGKLGFGFTKIDSSGNGLTAAAGSWSCVRDNVTGRTWEIKTADGGLRDVNNTYTNYNSTSEAQKFNGSVWVKPTQADLDAPTNARVFVMAVNAAKLCGRTDWRIPTADELQSIVDYSVEGLKPAIDAAWFINTRSIAYWSSDNQIAASTNSYIVDFDPNKPTSIVHTRDTRDALRLVSSIPSGQQRYSVSTDGNEVTDINTGLIWRRCTEGMVWNGNTCTGTPSEMPHENALAFAKSQTGWRLPNIKELSSIIDRDNQFPSIDIDAFPATLFDPGGPQSRWQYWSSTPQATLYNGESPNALIAAFSVGSVAHRGRIFSGVMRLVR